MQSHPTKDNSPIDFQKGIELFSDEPLFIELLSMWNYKEQLARLHTAMKEKDWIEIGKKAHWLKGPAK